MTLAPRHASRSVALHRNERQARAAATGWATIVACLLLVAGCGREPAPPVGTPPIVLITLDTMRPDHLGVYGYARNTSPHLDAFAAQADVYLRAHATSPWTLPSHASIFTGLYPHEHGAHTFWPAGLTLEELRETDSRDHEHPLSEDTETMAETLRQAGYATAGIVANSSYLHERFGFSQGFDHYNAWYETAPEVNVRVFEWLDGRPSGPFFLFVNYMDTHQPYNTTPREGVLDRDVPPYSDPTAREVGRRVLMREPVTAASMELVRDWYDLAIANVDAGLGELLDRMKRDGIFDEALIVITSDHGEYFGEHDLFAHSKDVYEPAMAIPLLIKRPGQTEGRVFDERVSLVHLYDLMGRHTDALDATSVPHRWPEPHIFGENHFSRLRDLKAEWGERFLRSRVVVYGEDLKYIFSSDGSSELYDLGEDPRERHDGGADRPRDVGRLHELLKTRIERAIGSLDSLGRQRQGPVARQPTPEERETLESLGYH